MVLDLADGGDATIALQADGAHMINDVGVVRLRGVARAVRQQSVQETVVDSQSTEQRPLALDHHGVAELHAHTLTDTTHLVGLGE